MKNKLKILLCILPLISGCMLEAYQTNKAETIDQAYASNYDRFFQNVVIKEKTPYYITYEYKDVRIDELAYLASRYCYEQGKKHAYLHDAILYRNFSRRATFDCLELQN